MATVTFTSGPLDALSTQTTPPTPAAHAMRLTPMQPPSGTYPSTAVPSAVQLVIPDAAHHGAPEVTPGFHESAGGLVHTTDVPGPPPASSLTEPSLSEAADALASDLERVRLDQPATTAEQPATTGSIVTPPPADPSSVLAATGRSVAGAGHRSRRPRPAPRRRDRATSSRHHHPAGRRLPRRARPQRQPAPPWVQCDGAHRLRPQVPRVPARPDARGGPAPHKDHRFLDGDVPGYRRGGRQRGGLQSSPQPEGGHRPPYCPANIRGESTRGGSTMCRSCRARAVCLLRGAPERAPWWFPRAPTRGAFNRRE